MLLVSSAKIFLTVCRTQSVLAAAKQLGLIQPAVSATAARLEKELGVDLVRCTRPIEIAPEEPVAGHSNRFVFSIPPSRSHEGRKSGKCNPIRANLKRRFLSVSRPEKQFYFRRVCLKTFFLPLSANHFIKREIQFSHEQGRLRRTRTVFNPISLSSSESRHRYLSKEAFYDLPVLSQSTHFHSS